MPKGVKKGYFMVVGAAFCWGIMGTLVKSLFVSQEVSPLTLTTVRATLAFPILLLILVAWDRQHLRVRLHDLPLVALVGVGGLAMANFTYYYTISLTNVATAILLQYMAPILVALFSAVFLRERVTWITLAALALAVGGDFLMVKGYDPQALRLNLPGLASGLLAACAFAFYTLLSKRTLERMDSWTLLTYAYAFAALFWWIVVPPWAIARQGYSLRLWGIFLVIAAFGTVLPFGLYVRGLTYLPATKASIASTLEPVVGAFAAFLVLGERLGFLQSLGGLMVLTGVVLVQRGRGGE